VSGLLKCAADRHKRVEVTRHRDGRDEHAHDFPALRRFRNPTNGERLLLAGAELALVQDGGAGSKFHSLKPSLR
jgi:hypothetical protein